MTAEELLRALLADGPNGSGRGGGYYPWAISRAVSLLAGTSRPVRAVKLDGVWLTVWLDDISEDADKVAALLTRMYERNASGFHEFSQRDRVYHYEVKVNIAHA